MRTIAILGSTGSIGTQALDVIRRNPEGFRVVGLATTGANQDLFIGQIREFLPPWVAISDPEAAKEIHAKVGNLPGVEILAGPDASERMAGELEADMVLNALVGYAGLGPTLAALQSGKTLALANKESLVIGGDLVMDLIKGEPERLLPVDSEHAALALAMRNESLDDIKRIIVTGSGGPFRSWTRDEMARASVNDALRHPVWAMGPKISIDSATLMNKGLEVIEAHHLFNLPYSQIDVLIHPEGLVHGMVEFLDGSIRAEMASPDMRLPIQLALAWPERLHTGSDPVRLIEKPLRFEEVDRETFPAVDLAYRVGDMGLTFPAVMNAANEVAVSAFLEGRIPLTAIVETVQETVNEHEPDPVVSVVSIERADRWARSRAVEMIDRR